MLLASKSTKTSLYQKMTDYFVDVTIWSMKDITEVADELGCGIDLRDLHRGYVIVINTTFNELSQKLTDRLIGPDRIKPTKSDLTK